MELDNIFLLNCSDISTEADKVNIKKLPLPDTELFSVKENDIRKNIKSNSLVSWTTNSESLSKSKKYYVDYKEQTYHIHILSYLDKYLSSHVKDISDVESIFQNHVPAFNSILYLFTDDEKETKRIYLFKLTKNIRLRDKTIVSIQLGKHQKKINIKLPTTNVSSLTIDRIDNGITLPMDNCISCFHIDADSKNSRVEVYDAFTFDELFATSQTQKKYAMTTISNFQNQKWKIAQNIITVGNSTVAQSDGIQVNFSNKQGNNKHNSMDDAINAKSVRRPLANYTDNVKRTIKRIDPNDLNRLIEELNKAVEDKNVKVNFNKNNIPKIDLKNKILDVTPDSIPIFSAMLENKLIEKLLSHEIFIPYYDTVKNKGLDIFEEIDWGTEGS